MKLGLLLIGIVYASDCDIVTKIWTGYGKTPLENCCMHPGVTCDKNSNVLKINWYNQNINGQLSPDFQNLKSLSSLNLSSNHLKDLDGAVGGLTSLKWLSLFNNSLQGSIPDEIGNLKQLFVLDFGKNKFTGSIPTTISSLKSLQGLWLDDNQLDGALPIQLAELSALKFFWIRLNRLTGTVPLEIQKMTNFKDFVFDKGLALDGQKTTDSRDVAGLTRDLPDDLDTPQNDCQYVFAAWEKFGRTTTLNKTDPEACCSYSQDIYDPWFGVVRVYDKSKEAQIGRVRCSGFQVIEIIWDEKSLYATDLPLELSHLVNLQKLSLQNNNLLCEIPDWIGNLNKLESLELTDTKMRGQIPESMSKLLVLSVLHLSANVFTGPFPQALKNLGRLEELQLSSNGFSGKIPDWIKEMTSLRMLDLHSNSFEGQIPESLGELKYLQALDLSDNKFTGHVPSFFSRIDSTKTDNNNFDPPPDNTVYIVAGCISGIVVLVIGGIYYKLCYLDK